ncbi:AraC family transcriptional regulator [Pseudooceanicola sediminis]|uniref:AraC family transcriptional regulator n=1 Tax=Pseudooceanicola sediminis TaxID=2211117 RepID=A0A399J0X3_9RHOB|nr:AraC family transcriptional regulator [Pseudooceanicola sediminis]KAA2316069.1 AraC family transcriptional regulator [Puniceibacterium sp. HSS470]RII38179.1 AraC family transcriptional regulator [Pseudooceanicola sediminis]|tara:strand:- start:25771 stop:26700 length:930 start_codon:yes stop_codon:yes gene_type:complete
MSDPLEQIIRLLRPRAVFSKGISGSGEWAVRYPAFGHPGFCAMTLGSCLLAVDGEAEILLEEGDFVLLPATPAFTMSTLNTVGRRVEAGRIAEAGIEVRHGRQRGPAEMRQFGGYFTFESPDAFLLVTLLPRLIHIRGAPRLPQLVRLVGDEAERDDIGRTMILERLIEILLIEALRSVSGATLQPGLLRGLADDRVVVALRLMHGDVERSWTANELAREVGMSRSAFFDRFSRTVGMTPMDYLLRWRMALAKSLLRAGTLTIEDVAARIGYGSASTFSTAFRRHVGQPPGRFMRSLHLPEHTGTSSAP